MEINIPEWAAYFFGMLMTGIVAIASVGLRVMMGIRQEVTILNVKMELVARQQHEIDQLWTLVRKLEIEVKKRGD